MSVVRKRVLMMGFVNSMSRGLLLKVSHIDQVDARSIERVMRVMRVMRQ